MSEESWYYCLDHSKVEPYHGCRSATRLGPYPTPAQAAEALDLVASRNVDWETDPRFNDSDPGQPADQEQH